MSEINLNDLNTKKVVRVDGDDIREIYSENLVEDFEGCFSTGRRYGRDGIKNYLKDILKQEFTDYGEVVYGKVYHKNGIGNNCQYLINYVTEEIIYEMGYLNINHNMYGSYIIYFEDMSEEKITEVFEVRAS